MEENDFGANLNKIIEKMARFEKKNDESNPKFQDWIEKITDPSFSLIPSLLDYFLDEMTPQETREKICKLLVKLMILQEETVTEQLLANKNFPIVCVQFITKGDKSKMSDNPFYLLTKLFQEEKFAEFINENFIEALFDGLAVVYQEDILIGIVEVLIEINSNYKNNNENLFLKVHKNNSNSRLIDELLLRVLNKETNKNKILKILLCLNNLMTNENCPIFYESDLESLIDIIMNKLQSTSTEDVKLFFLQTLAKVTSYEAYYHSKYKDEELIELMTDFLDRDDQSNEVKQFAQEVSDNIANH